MPESPCQEVDTYIAAFDSPVRERLESIRSLVRSLLPEYRECLSYGIPTFDYRGKHLVHYAAFARHTGLYPAPTGMEHFAQALAPYKQGKGSVQFPHSQPLPMELIRRIVEFRMAELDGDA